MAKETDDILWKLYTNGIIQLHNKYNSISKKPKPKPVTEINYTLDLHHYTVNQAYLMFMDFIDEHKRLNTKQVMVITGKSGIIKNEFENWCLGMKIKKIILRANGGSYYLRLY